MRIISFQPGSLYQNGGAARVLRRLFMGRESQVFSIGIVYQKLNVKEGNITEKLVGAFPLQRKWMRWHLRTAINWLRENLFISLTIRNIRKVARENKYDVIHIVNHGPFSLALLNKGYDEDKKLWVSFHDHFSTSNSPKADTEKLWNRADRRLVISEELGMEYQRLFGNRAFEIITDGLFPGEVSAPKNFDGSDPIIIYFAGLLHIDYYPLFELLAAALDDLTRKGMQFKLVLRGTQALNFLNNRSFGVEYKLDFVSDEEIKCELDSASILYLPIKFSQPDFYLYSLSTKMVGYLGASGTVLYHGPADSAAGNLLQKDGAAVCCNSLVKDDLIRSIYRIIDGDSKYSQNAKELALTQFNFKTIQQRFWQEAS
ncbi:MAG TPA: glycosyltransferase [Mucilaginibacter sp.]|jgi:hypothetical protein